ncbi:hypothetical protein [Mesomycoplasma ovipneumoniae]|uniref:hypothetical protein n=1 Tax=Mesomycoplasma ovipneumoniae TaxID=29562 RepID=UPI0028A76072|nr:hypothetical protein [Mesomycoplasma ovipneumoniae]WNM14202.1 hypothetical protein RNL96_03725 [Mesomycoplasma ovipneumoniae]
MKKKLKFFKFITNIVAFTSLTLSVFGPLWHFQNTKSYSDFKLETRDIDLSNSKKPVNFDDLVQIVSTKNQQNSFVINANIKNSQTRLNKTSTNSHPPNLDDIEIQINEDGQVILNSASLELVNKKLNSILKKVYQKLKFEGHVFDFRQLQNKTRVEKTVAPAIAAAPAAGLGALFWYAVGAAIVGSVIGIAALVFFRILLVMLEDDGIIIECPSCPQRLMIALLIQEVLTQLKLILDKLTKGKSKSRIKTIAGTTILNLSVVKDETKLRNYTGIHPAWFFNFHTEGLKSYFVISEQAIPETAAWIWAVSNLTMQSKLTQIVIDTFLPSWVKAKINKNEWDRKNMEEKLKSPIDFYSFNRLVMWNLAEKTRDTANLIVGNWRLAEQNNNLNKDPGFTKGPFVTGSGLAHDSIDWTDPKNAFEIPDKQSNPKSYTKIFFPSYHVRRVRLKKKRVDRDKMLNVEKVHFLYGKPIRFEV